MLYLKNYRAHSDGSDNGDDGVSVGASANTNDRSDIRQTGGESYFVGCLCLNLAFSRRKRRL